MSSMNYQKVYMNQIHSSSLLCQLSHMWKGQMLCDAIIKTGQVITKAHRVVLVAACPMLQSMENASAGSHLEVRLAADIKQESVNTFLQYLYEGFMMLTEENVRDVEKVGRLLQVDSVIKCCADFYKCMNAKTGAPFPGSSYKYSFSGHDLAEFRHVRATGLQKTASERIIKRVSDFPRPGSPGSKRPRLYRGGSPSDVTVIGSDKADDTASMSHSYMSGAPDPWDRVPKLGSGMSRQGATGRNSQPGVIEIIEERIELVQTEPPEKDSGQPSSSRSSQKSAAVSIAVTSQFNTEPDISVVNVFGSPETQSTTAASNAITSSSSSRGSITVSPLTIFQEPHPQSSSAPEPSSSSSTVESSGQVSEIQFAGFSQRQDVVDSVYGMGKQQKSVDSQLTSTPHQRPFPVSVSPITQPKPFAAGSAVQAGISSPSSMSLPLGSPSSSKSVQKPRSAPASPAERARDSRRASEAAGMHSTADMTPDLSIVKIESSNHETGGLDMHVDMPEEGVMRIHPGRMPDEQEEASDKEIEDWAREEMSNEGSNISGDQNNSWYMGTFKGRRSDKWRTRGLVLTGESQNSSATSQLGLQSAAPGLDISSGLLLENNTPVFITENSTLVHQIQQGTPKGKNYTVNPSFDVSEKGVDEQAVFEGTVPENCNVNLDSQEREAVYEIFGSSYSRQNFAWRLVRYMYEDSELKDHNCYGRKGKPSLKVEKLCKVKDLVFAYYPLEDDLLQQRAWKACTVAIDKGIRNTFCDYHPRQQPGDWSFDTVTNQGT
ncbi:uncharacterized protein LOC110459952 isoform X10 [Mizuhopecten yessoensis]|uniref:uncharacterized protein LOC110459952 isoform X10 n=1 Tax=Mizuhopecten yessoensis TaxID=6573 RepID=UPI000B45BB4A|nr:uncharacterized protein LOC110459952 isoform X10 [Mizuhopecten yessoensis]